LPGVDKGPRQRSAAKGKDHEADISAVGDDAGLGVDVLAQRDPAEQQVINDLVLPVGMLDPLTNFQ